MLKRCAKSLGFKFFVSDIISGVGFRLLWLRLPDPGPNHKREVFHSSFYWKPGQNLLSLLIGFLAFKVQKLWANNNKLITDLNRGLIHCFLVFRP